MKSLATLLDKFMKDLIIQAMVSEQERNENKRRQAQGIRCERKGVYKGHPFYSTNPQNVLLSSSSCRNVREGQAISKIAKRSKYNKRLFIELNMGLS